jgi:hypothetical protein
VTNLPEVQQQAALSLTWGMVDRGAVPAGGTGHGRRGGSPPQGPGRGKSGADPAVRVPDNTVLSELDLIADATTP